MLDKTCMGGMIWRMWRMWVGGGWFDVFVFMLTVPENIGFFFQLGWLANAFVAFDYFFLAIFSSDYHRVKHESQLVLSLTSTSTQMPKQGSRSAPILSTSWKTGTSTSADQTPVPENKAITPTSCSMSCTSHFRSKSLASTVSLRSAKGSLNE